MLSCLLVGGAVALDLTVFTLPGEGSGKICALRPAWFTLSFAMLFAPLLAKTYRTWRIFDNPRMRNVRLSKRTSVLQIGMVVFTVPSQPLAHPHPLSLALPCSRLTSRIYFTLALRLAPNLWARAQWLLLNVVVLALFFGGIEGFSSTSAGTYLTENKTVAIAGLAGAEYEYNAWCAPQLSLFQPRGYLGVRCA